MENIYTSKCFSFIACVVDTSEQLIPGVVDTRDKLSFGNIIQKILNGLNEILRGPGDTDSWKNRKSKISSQTPFKKTQTN